MAFPSASFSKRRNLLELTALVSEDWMLCRESDFQQANFLRHVLVQQLASWRSAGHQDCSIDQTCLKAPACRLGGTSPAKYQAMLLVLSSLEASVMTQLYKPTGSWLKVQKVRNHAKNTIADLHSWSASVWLLMSSESKHVLTAVIPLNQNAAPLWLALTIQSGKGCVICSFIMHCLQRCCFHWSI